MRTEAQKAADRRYNEKTKGRVVTWATALKREEAEEVDKVIKEAGLSKAEFIRRAAKQLKKEGN